ncbi:MAG: hypothetical protein ACR2HO_08235, partial [Rubrobacteraceae bacterium]
MTRESAGVCFVLRSGLRLGVRLGVRRGARALVAGSAAGEGPDPGFRTPERETRGAVVGIVAPGDAEEPQEP